MLLEQHTGQRQMMCVQRCNWAAYTQMYVQKQKDHADPKRGLSRMHVSFIYRQHITKSQAASWSASPPAIMRFHSCVTTQHQPFMLIPVHFCLQQSHALHECKALRHERAVQVQKNTSLAECNAVHVSTALNKERTAKSRLITESLSSMWTLRARSWTATHT